MTQAIERPDSKTNLAPLLPQQSFAEFFAGIGLMRMGLERGGWSIAFANDIDPQKLSMYKDQFPDAEQHFILGDIHQIPAGIIPSVTLATASFPCNDLSLAGARKGLSGKESSAFWGFIRVLHEMHTRRPLLVLLENVPGLLTCHGGNDFHTTLQALNRLGYYVDAFMLDAANFAPQSRQRLFISHIAKGGAQIKGASGARVKAILDYHGEHRRFVSEGGRTNRGLPSQMRDMLDAILDGISDTKRYREGWVSGRVAPSLLFGNLPYAPLNLPPLSERLSGSPCTTSCR